MIEFGEIIEWGQGYDDDIYGIIKSFNKFRDAYYELNDYDEWWDVFNQDVWFHDAMAKEWKQLEDADIDGCIERMAKQIVGTYVRFDKFFKGIEESHNEGYGFKHKKEGKANENNNT